LSSTYDRLGKAGIPLRRLTRLLSMGACRLVTRPALKLDILCGDLVGSAHDSKLFKRTRSVGWHAKHEFQLSGGSAMTTYGRFGLTHSVGKLLSFEQLGFVYGFMGIDRSQVCPVG
jgi:hypothetical protein